MYEGKLIFATVSVSTGLIINVCSGLLRLFAVWDFRINFQTVTDNNTRQPRDVYR